jgi:hypothetical protein
MAAESRMRRVEISSPRQNAGLQLRGDQAYERSDETDYASDHAAPNMQHRALKRVEPSVQGAQIGVDSVAP